MTPLLDPSDLFNVSLQGGVIQELDTRWDQSLLSASELLEKNVMEIFYKMRIRESHQLHTVLAL